MRGTRALLAAVIVMGVMILVGTGALVGVIASRAMHPPRPAALSAGIMPPTLLDQPPGTRIASVARQSDTLLAVTLSGGGIGDRLLIWDIATGHVVARLTPSR